MNMNLKLFLAATLLNCFVAFAQLAQKGNIILADNQKIAFNNVRLENGKFVFFDIKSGAESSLAISEVKYIEDDRNSKVFTNKTVVDKSREADLKFEAEQKRLAIEAETRKVAEYQKKLEAEKIMPAYDLYPAGIYATKEDFLNKKPNNTEEIVPKELEGIEKEIYYGIPNDCFFYYKQSDKKVKNCFAVSYRGNLYFQIQAILNNRNKTDRAQSNDYPNSFARTQIHGDNYYYLEADLANFWAQGAAVGGFGIIVGGAMAEGMINGKGIVWDIKNKEFNIFKNCYDFNDFIRDKYPAGVQPCEKQQANIELVRKAMEKVK